MATAHGAGVMILPLVLPDAPPAHTRHAGMMLAGVATTLSPGWTATLLHTFGYLGMTMLMAVIVYERIGVGGLRRAWINLDLLWSGALILTGVLTAVV
jgi:hypothetical protein